MKRHKKIFWSFFLLITLFLLPELTSAQSSLEQDYQRFIKPFTSNAVGSATVTVAANETIEDNFVRYANKITIDGDVQGDVIVAAGTLTVNGKVSGDVIAAADKITINGPVTGNVRIAAGQVEINNTVGKNVNIFAGTAILSNDASVGWTLSFFTGQLTVNSSVMGNIYGFGGQVKINNIVGNNVTLILDQTGQATLGSNGIINGDFNYRGDKNAIIETGAIIKGDTIHKLIPLNILKARKILSFSWIFSKLINLFSLLLVGTLLVSLFEKKSRQIVNQLMLRPAPKMFRGLLILIIVPIVAVLIAITIIGIPLALIMVGAYILLTYISPIFIGLFIGQKLINTSKKDKKESPLIWTMMLGVFIYVVLINIPYIGWLFSLIGTVWFLGTIWHLIISYRKSKKDKNNEKDKPKSI